PDQVQGPRGVIAPASARDVRAIAAVEAAVSSSPWSWAAVGELLEREGAIVLVAREGEAVVGHVLATAVAGEGEILDLAVLPDARRRGHGRALLRALEEAWRARGVAAAFLEVRTDNGPARALYEGL